MPINKILIVGAGPAGLLLALQLARHSINVTVLDAASSPNSQPRATHYGPPGVAELRRAGILDDVRKLGFVPKGIMWRKIDGTPIAGLDASDVPEGEGEQITCLPLNQLGELLHKHLLAQPTAKLLWRHNVVGLGQDDNVAWVDVEVEGEGEGKSEKKRMEAEYVVGCDGANSQVRRSLFGDSFPGRTWDQQIVATNVFYDFDRFGWGDSSFIIDAENWFMAARINKGAGKDAQYRVTYGDTPGLTTEEYVKRQPKRYETILPGHPKPGEYRLTNISPYKIHQRCAEKMRVGRVLLAADAAHLCNPFGGLGLTGGIVDVGALYDCLLGIHNNRASSAILDKYDEVRRDIYHNIIDKHSSENFRRVRQDPDKILERDEFLKLCKRTETDKDFSKAFQMAGISIIHDFTQYYDKPA